jgi:hypothetical protein
MDELAISEAARDNPNPHNAKMTTSGLESRRVWKEMVGVAPPGGGQFKVWPPATSTISGSQYPHPMMGSHHSSNTTRGGLLFVFVFAFV